MGSKQGSWRTETGADCSSRRGGYSTAVPSTSSTRGPVCLYLPRVASVPRRRLRRNARRPFLLLIHCARLNALDRRVHGILATVTSSVQHEFGKQRIWPHAFAAFSASPTWLAFLQLSKAGPRLAVTLSTRQLIMSLFLYCSASQPI